MVEGGTGQIADAEASRIAPFHENGVTYDTRTSSGSDHNGDPPTGEGDLVCASSSQTREQLSIVNPSVKAYIPFPAYGRAQAINLFEDGAIYIISKLVKTHFADVKGMAIQRHAGGKA